MWLACCAINSSKAVKDTNLLTFHHRATHEIQDVFTSLATGRNPNTAKGN